MLTKRFLLLVALVAGFLFIITPAYATLIELGAEPVLSPGDGNVKCADIGCTGIEFEIESPSNGTFYDSVTGLGVTISTDDGKVFDWWTSGAMVVDGQWIELCAVIVKGGKDANVYDYRVAGSPVWVSGDTVTGLQAPLNGGGNIPDLSSIRFCYTAVPEPSTMILLGSALIGLGLLGRRKFKI